MAMHPGELERILLEENARYHDDDLATEIAMVGAGGTRTARASTSSFKRSHSTLDGKIVCRRSRSRLPCIASSPARGHASRYRERRKP
jgi:hypothetical protein